MILSSFHKDVFLPKYELCDVISNSLNQIIVEKTFKGLILSKPSVEELWFDWGPSDVSVFRVTPPG